MGSGGTRPRLALVSGGGAIQAYAFHLGVLQGLQEDRFYFRSGLRWDPSRAPERAREIDIFVGSSAGACVAAAVASGHPVDQMRAALTGEALQVPTFGYRTLFQPVAPNPAKYVARLRRRWRFGRLGPADLVAIGGLISSAGVERYYRRHVLPTNRFADLAAELYVTATQVNNARKVVFGPRDSLTGSEYDPDCAYYDNVPVSQAIAAAVAVPPVFAPYGIVNPSSGERIHYYDGEVRETLSAHVATDAGADFVIAASIWSPYRYDERLGTVADLGMAAMAEQAINQLIEQKVSRDRERAECYDELLDLLRAHDANHGVAAAASADLRQRVCELLRYRPVPTLFISPEDTDTEFFLESSFSFGRGLVDRCIDAGHRAYRRAAHANPMFFVALDEALDPSAPRKKG